LVEVLVAAGLVDPGLAVGMGFLVDVPAGRLLSWICHFSLKCWSRPAW